MSNNDENISKDVEMLEETSFVKEDVEMTDAEPVKKEQSAKKSTGGVATKLFVGSLSFKTDDAGLEEHFASAGKVLSAKIITDRETGRSRGFGFVEMASEPEAQTAINNLHGKELDGRTLAVNIAEKKEGGGARTGGGFAGRGGDSRGGFAGRSAGGDSRGGFAGRGAGGDSRGGFGGAGRGDSRGGDNRGNGGGRGDNRGGFGGGGGRGGDSRGNGGGRAW